MSSTPLLSARSEASDEANWIEIVHAPVEKQPTAANVVLAIAAVRRALDAGDDSSTSVIEGVEYRSIDELDRAFGTQMNRGWGE